MVHTGKSQAFTGYLVMLPEGRREQVACCVDREDRLRLFPKDADGLQLILSRYIENDLEMEGFKG